MWTFWLWVVQPPLPPNPLVNEARMVVERHCGDCHRSDSPKANPKALRVFTLNDEDWAFRMSRIQLEQGMLTRARETGSIPREDVALLERFVARELERRGR